MPTIVKRRRRIGSVTRINRVLSSSPIQGFTDKEASLLKFADRSNSVADPFEGSYMDMAGGVSAGAFAPLQPEFDLQKMSHIVTISNILRQCIDAMVTNTTSYGYQLEYVGPEGEEDNDEQKAEHKVIRMLLKHPAPGETLRQILERFRHDKEVLGYRCLEVIRDDDNTVVSFGHLPAISMRKTRQERKPLTYFEDYMDDETGEIEPRRVTRRFRRYVQKTGLDTIFFKEFGDPRAISYKTGAVIPEEEVDARSDELATEVVWDEFYTPGASYGQPRWFGVLPGILASRELELVNLNFFRENAIPAMAIMVSGGALTAETFDNLRQYITAVKGKDAMQRVMVLEAAADDTAGDISHTPPSPKIEMKPMLSERQQDGLFQKLDDHNIVKVRSAFRLPPILIGKAEDYTRASALASVQTAENQVFGPERGTDDGIINLILGTHGIRFWRYKSLGPATTDAEEMATVVDSLGAQGALTPNVVIKLANKVLGVQIEPVLEDWGDYPFSIIEQMIASGTQIKGLTSFIESVAPPTTTEPGKPASANDNSGNKPPQNLRDIKRSIRRMRTKRDLRKALQSLQETVRAA